jgi:hypothetical protein
MATTKIRYVRNLTPNSVRIGSINIGPRGQRDVAEVPDDVFVSANFAPSVGLLVEEITKADYQERIVAKWHEPVKQSKQQEIFHVDSQGKEQKLPVTLEIEQDAVRIPLDTAGYAGAERVMGSRPDDGGGKTLSEMRTEGNADNPDVSAELGI